MQKKFIDQRPRWGLYSVIDHRNVSNLIPELLLFDRLIFPYPSDDQKANWKPEWDLSLLDKRLSELKGLVHTRAWTKELRSGWSKNFEKAKQIVGDVEGLAYGMTPVTLAMSVWEDNVPPPVPIVSFPDERVANLVLKVVRADTDGKWPALNEINLEVGALFSRELAVPIAEKPQKAYESAIMLAHDPKYQEARRALYDWEDRRAIEGWPAKSAIKELKDLVFEHENLIKKTFKKTVARRVFRFVQLGGAAAIELTDIPLLGLGTAFAMELIAARFPVLSEKPSDPNKQPGAALHMAISALTHN